MGINNFRQFYTVESSVYHRKRYQTLYGKLFEKLHHQVLTDILNKRFACDLVLEVACGTGHVSELLAAQGIDFIACDLTSAMMEQARQRIKEFTGKIKFIQADAIQLPFIDNSFNFIISTRFMHLFPLVDQRIIIKEMLRILKPSGYLVLDFDNWTSRWLLAIPYFLYNLIRYKRVAPFSHYNRVGETIRMIQQEGLIIEEVLGVGGTHLLFPALISFNWAVKIGKVHQHLPLRLMAEQFVITGFKK